MNGDDKIRGAAIKSDSKAVGWLENFWYHYKWPTIIVSFFLIVILVCTLQTCGKESEDFTVVYAGPKLLTQGEVAAIEDVLNYIMPEDFNKDGKKLSGMISYQIYSKEQILDIEDDGSKDRVDRNYNSGNNDSFYDYAMTGETSVYILDPAIYKDLLENNRVMKLEEAFGSTHEASSDGYGIKLSDLGIYEAYGAVRVLPEDSVVCILRPTVFGRTSKEAEYANDKKIFSEIIYFSDEK